MISYRTGPNGQQYRQISEPIYDALRGRLWVLVEVADGKRPKPLSVAEWSALEKPEENAPVVVAWP